jgi:hypothetical protein
VELGGTAERLARAHGVGALPGVMDEDDGEAIAALQIAQVGERLGDLAADILADAVQADEWIEEHSGLQPGDGLVEFALIGFEIELQDISTAGAADRRPVRSSRSQQARRQGARQPCGGVSRARSISEREPLRGGARGAAQWLRRTRGRGA